MSTTPMKFSADERAFLDAFYRGHKAKTPRQKIDTLREWFIREPMCISHCSTDREELLSLEYLVLMNAGFDV